MMDFMQLAHCPLLEGMSDSELLALSAIFSEKTISAGMAVFIENMPGESLYLIQTGTVRISKMLGEGEEKSLVVLNAEDLFGEMAILDGAPRSATARVIEEARLWCLKKDDFESFCEVEPKIGLKLIRNIVKVFSKRIRESNQELRELFLWSKTTKA